MPHGASAFWAQAPCFLMSCGGGDTPRMVFHIAVCSPDNGLRTAVQRAASATCPPGERLHRGTAAGGGRSAGAGCRRCTVPG